MIDDNSLLSQHRLQVNFCHRFQNSCSHCNGTGKIIDSKRVGAFLKEKREAMPNSLNSVAKRMGISAPYLSDLENGNRAWSFDRITQFETCLVTMSLLKSGGKIWIYGLFNSGGECDYVGATSNPKKRRTNHITGFKELKLKFTILTSCDRSKAANKESEIIKFYKSKGQCRLNKVSHAINCRGWENPDVNSQFKSQLRKLIQEERKKNK